MYVGRCFILRVLLIFSKLLGYAKNTLYVKRFQNCNPSVNYDGHFNFTFKTVDKAQYLDGTLTLKDPLSNAMESNVSFDILTGKTYRHVFSIHEKKSCDAIHKFYGEFIYDLERTAQKIPGICPMPKGLYQWHNYKMEYEKITTLANFPFGKIRITSTTTNRNAIYICTIAEVEH